jgi:tetratricopeptide (TPR) repeat protein
MKMAGSLVLALLWALGLSAGVCLGGNGPEAAFRQGLEQGAQGNFAAAREALQQALEADPFYAPALVSLEAVQDVLERKITPQTGIHLLRAMVQGGRGDWESYLAEVGQALEFAPGYAEAYNHRGNAYLELGHYDEALSDYDQALKLKPRSPGIFNNRGVAFRKTGQLDRALADYNRALELNPAFAAAYYNRALTYRQKGKLELALMDFDRALTLNPRYLEAHFNKALVCEQAGHYQEAAVAFKDFLRQARPEYEVHIQHARERLVSLEQDRRKDFQQAEARGPDSGQR